MAMAVLMVTAEASATGMVREACGYFRCPEGWEVGWGKWARDEERARSR
jgi:hypothetical protein